MNDPANAASVALIDGDRVLLIRRARAPFAGLWTLPGGRLEAGETLEQCAAREVREELGLAVAALRHVGTQFLSGPGWSWVLAVFASRTFEGEIVASAEIAEHRWVGLAEVSALDSTPGLPEVLARAFEAAGS